MTDEEIIDRIKKADALLEEYVKLVTPAVKELARRKSLHVYGREGAYRPDLGCWEEGINTVCLHIEDSARGESWEKDEPLFEKAKAFEDEWQARIQPRHIYISGHC